MTNQQNGRAVAQRETNQAIEGVILGASLLLSLPKERQEVLRKQIAPGASDIELEYFLQSAERNDLDPFAVPVQITCFPSRAQVKGQWVDRWTPLVEIDGWRVKLMRTGRVEDIEIEWCGADLVWRDVWADEKTLVAARASIWISGRPRPVRFVCHLDDFIRYKSGSNEPQENWKRRRHMLAIRALSHCAKQFLAIIGHTGDLFTPDVIGEDDQDGHGNAQRRFWGTAKAMGMDEPRVRELFHIQPEERMSEFIERYGGYAKAQAYLEVKGPVLMSLPDSLPRPSVDDLYSEPVDPVAASRAAQAGMKADMKPDMVSPLTGEIRDAAPAAESDEPHEASEEETTDLPDEPITVGACEVCEEPVIDTGSGVLRCDLHREEDAAYPPMPAGLKNVATLKAALPSIGADLRDLAALGTLPRVEDEEVWRGVWQRLCARVRARRAQEPALPLGEG